MSLSTYEKKRNFDKTSEPKAGKSTGSKLSFVIQRHHASRLHYDFRLEMEGVLKSWAVPKGPSLNPKDKRLAMMVEDHPYDYKDFEGSIPKGNYGAGTVSIWDKGTYTTIEKSAKPEKDLLAQLKSGNLKFKLSGKKLKGEFALVKMKDTEQNAWLLIKHDDGHAVHKKYNSEDEVPATIKKKGLDFKKDADKPEKAKPVKETKAAAGSTKKKSTPLNLKPMLATLADAVFDDEDWVYEQKFDGYRMLATTGRDIKLTSRNGIDFTGQYYNLIKELEKIGADAVMDGETVVTDKNGKNAFQSLKGYDPATKGQKLNYYAFDILYLNGHDLTGMPLVKRKELLKTLLKSVKSTMIRYSEHINGAGQKLFDKAAREKWEGIIGKQADSTYEPGRRTKAWLKFKLNNTQDAIICGFTKPSGSRKYFGSLVLGVKDGKEIRYIGNCGTGYNEALLKEIHGLLKGRITDEKPFPQKAAQLRGATWVKPELVCEVTYSEWTNDRHLRHPVFKGLRKDKKPADTYIEQPKTMEEKETPKTQTSKGRKGVKLTNPDKIFWPKEKITKGDLVDYYEHMADYILPWMKDKPQSLKRQPNGILDDGFFHKDFDQNMPKGAFTVKMVSENSGKEVDYLVCNNLTTLLFMANLGCIELNPWLSTYKKPDHPEYMVIDLDPQDVDFKEVIKAALVSKEVLDEMKITSFIKTSGSRGMHIYVYMGAKYHYDQVRMFCELVVSEIHSRLPDLTSLVRSPAKRKNKIYLDYLQNRRGQTIATLYSVRPKPGATVATPLDWKEVNEKLDPKKFTIFTVPERVKKVEDPWKDIKKHKVDLKKVLKDLKNPSTFPEK